MYNAATTTTAERKTESRQQSKNSEASKGYIQCALMYIVPTRLKSLDGRKLVFVIALIDENFIRVINIEFYRILYIGHYDKPYPSIDIYFKLIQLL